MSRMKAPAGGMVVNKQMQSGGQFLAKAMKGIRETAAKLVRLARAGDPATHDQLVRAAREKLNDPAPRFAFSDFLQENGLPGAHVVAAHAAHAQEHGGPATTRPVPAALENVSIFDRRFTAHPVVHLNSETDPTVVDGGGLGLAEGQEHSPLAQLFYTGVSGRQGNTRIVPGALPVVLAVNHRTADATGTLGSLTRNSLLSYVHLNGLDDFAKHTADFPPAARKALLKQFVKHLPVGQRRVKLARPEHERASLPGSAFTGAEITKPLTIRELKEVEDAHGLGKDSRLSHKVLPDRPEHGDASTFWADKGHVAKFINALTKKRLVGHELRSALADPSKTDEHKIAYLGAHMATEAREFLDHTQANGSPEWYGAHVDAYEQALRNAFGFKPGSPEMTLVKAIVAATSSGTNPKTNGIAVYRMLRAGKKNNPENPILGIPAYDHDKTQEFREELAKRNGDKPVPKPGFSDRKAGKDPQAEAAWYTRYVMPHADLADDPGYRGYTGVMVNRPGHPDHGKLVAYQNGTDEDGDPIMVKTPEGGGLYNKHRELKVGAKKALQRVLLPETDPATGDLRPKGWNGKPAQVESGLNRIQSLIKDLGMKGAQDWLLSEHPISEFQQRFNYTPQTRQIGTEKDAPVPGMFVLGPKFGAFALNLHANRPETRQHAKWLTADLWWSRTWNRMMGTMFTGKAKKDGVTAPRSPTERKAMAAAAAVATKAAGLRSVAELQAVIWYYEQSLYRMLGVKQAKSYSFLDAASAITNLHAKDTGKNSLDDIADSWHSILKHVAEPSGWTPEQRKQAVLDILMDAAMERTPGSGKKQETAARQLVQEWEQRANTKEAPTKLARKDPKPSVTGLQALDTLAARLKAFGRMPTPHMLVQAILTGQRAADHVQAAPVVKLARTEAPPEHVLYVSPSTREGSTFEQAFQGMASPDMQALTEAAKLQPTVRAVHPALGMWKDGAEESNVVHVGDPAQLRPIAEKLGRAFRQKAVLTFSGEPDGPDARHVLIVPESDPTKINGDMERHGIQFKTMVRDPKGTRVEVVDVGGVLGPQIEGYAKEARALSHVAHRGTHQFVETT